MKGVGASVRGSGALIPPFQLLLLIQVPRGLLSLSWTQPLNLIIPPSKAPLFSLLHKVVGTGAASSPLGTSFITPPGASAGGCGCTSRPSWRSLRTFHGGYLRQLVANEDIPLDLPPPLERLTLHPNDPLCRSDPQMVAFTDLGNLGWLRDTSSNEERIL